MLFVHYDVNKNLTDLFTVTKIFCSKSVHKKMENSEGKKITARRNVCIPIQTATNVNKYFYYV